MPDQGQPHPSAWKTLGRESMLSVSPWFEVFRERVQLPSGRVIDDFYRIVLPSFAMIAATTPSGDVVMVRGYKHGLERVNLSPPAGLIEPGEEPLAAAQRELLEETGYISDDWSFLGKFVVDGNRQCGTMYLFRAKNVRARHAPRDDELEQLNVELMRPARVIEGLRTGEIGNLAGAGGVAIALLLD